MTLLLGGPDEFQAALSSEGSVSLFTTTCGQFRARVTRVELHRLRLSAIDEHLPRIGFLAVPTDMVLVSFPIGDQPGPMWGGIRPSRSEFITFGPGHRVHMRTQGPCRWGAIWFSARELAGYFHDLTEVALAIPSVAQTLRPPSAPGRRLLQFHGAAIRAAEARPETIVNAAAAHGMEQQLIEALVECLSAGVSTKKQRQDTDIGQSWLVSRNSSGPSRTLICAPKISARRSVFRIAFCGFAARKSLA